MRGLLFTSTSGWVAALLLAFTSLVPWIVRPETVSRLRLHFWAAYALAPLCLVHSWPAMSEGWIRKAAGTGLNMASGAFLLIVAQVGLGLLLRSARGRERLRLRRIHLLAMIAVVALSGGHVAFNSVLLR